MTSFKTIRGRGKLLGFSVPQEVPIALDPVIYEGAVVYGDDGRYYASDGVDWFDIGQGPQGIQGIQGIQGTQGIQGNFGPAIKIIGSVENVNVSPPDDPQEVLNTAFPSKEVGDSVIDQETSDLWAWDGNQWVNVGEVRGPQGIQGIQGPQGVQGIQGVQGEAGNQGTQGIQGIGGEIGAQGLQGIQGIQGNFGPQGIQGLDGEFAGQGVQGPQGVQGLQGNFGIQGIQGVQGIQGNFGPQGIQGLDGEFAGQGVQGIQGIQGLDGEFAGQGVQGPQGVQGIQGPEGSDPDVSITDDTTTDATRYVTFVDQTTGDVSGFGVSSSKLFFNPLTGTLNASEFNSLSDMTMKEDLIPLDLSSNLLDRINTYSFRWKETGTQSYGVIAQELEEIMPELVNDVNGKKYVNYLPLIALLVSGYKEMKKELDVIKEGS